MAHTEHHGARANSTAVGHETTDANLGGVERLMVVIAILLGASFGLVWWMFHHFAAREAALDVKPSPVVARRGDRLPPLPRLQTLPIQELAAFRRGEATALDTWAWVDKQRGIAQIPIARAIEILSERGLPAPPPAAAPAPATTATGAVPAAAPAATPPPKSRP